MKIPENSEGVHHHDNYQHHRLMECTEQDELGRVSGWPNYKV